MKINRIHIENFRSILNETVDLGDIATLVGPNGCGKSSVLRAIQVFYDTTISITKDDYFNRNDSFPIKIQVTYESLKPRELELFSPYIQDETLTITKVISPGIIKYHGTKRQHQRFNELRQLGKRERITAYRNLRNEETYVAMPSATSSELVDTNLAQWEQQHPDQCEMMEDDGQFFGFRQVGQARLERFTRFVFVPAVRDAEDDAADAKGSAIFQLMELVVRSVLANNEDFKAFRTRVQTEYNTLINPETLPQLNELATKLSQVLKYYVPSASVLLNWQAAENIEVPLPKAAVCLEEDGFEANVQRVGHGLQRAFILSLLQSLAIAQASQRSTNDQTEEQIMPDLILAIEEPELYQHPNRQRHLSKILLDLSHGRIAGVAEKTQVIYCTHSPLFVDLARFDSVCRLSKVMHPTDVNVPMVTKVSRTSITKVAEMLRAAQDTQDRPFTAETLKPRMASIMTPWLNEGFFGDVVVLVEGPGDRSAIMGCAAYMGIDFEAKGIAVIPCNGKNSIDRPLIILSELGIPVYVVFDADANNPPDKRDEKTNRILQRLLGLRQPTDLPNTTVREKYAIFCTNLDTYLRDAVGKLYDEVATYFVRDCGYQDINHCKKSPDFIAKVLELAHTRKNEVPELQQIVQNVIALVPSRA